MTIDEEIKQFFLDYRIREKIMPYNMLPEYLQKIQHYVLTTHEHLDGDMLVRILSQIRYEAGDSLDNDTWKKVNLLIQDALDEIPFISKVSTIDAYGDISPELKQALEKVNSYRNEFAHPRVEALILKYDINTQTGKVNIRNVARALKRAQELFLDHAEFSEATKYYVAKQIEREEPIA